MDDFMTTKQRQQATYLGAGVAAAAAAIGLFLIVRLFSGGGDGPVGPVPSSIASASPSASIDISADTILRLEVNGVPIIGNPQALPPVFELADGKIIALDFPDVKERGLLAQLRVYSMTPAAASALISEAKVAGLAGEAFLSDPTNYLPVSYTLTLIRGGQITDRVTLNGVVEAGESGSDSARRASLWAFIERLLDPVASLALGAGAPYQPARYLVRASPIDLAAAKGEGETDFPTFTFSIPNSWTAGCRVFTDNEIAPLIAALSAESFGRTWLDAGGAAWILVGRPLTPTEADPCQ